MCQGDTPFLAKAQALGYPRLGPPRGIGEPVFRQVELEAEGPGELRAEQHRGHGHLAIGDFAERAAILPLHPDRVFPLLREAGVVEGQNAAPHRYKCAHLGPHRPL